MAHAPANDPGASPIVFETLATTGGTPRASRTGKVMRVPEPTTVLMNPAQTPARPDQQEVGPGHR